jgi:hypothetical protein
VGHAWLTEVDLIVNHARENMSPIGIDYDVGLS